MSKKLVYKLIAISLAAGTALTQIPTTVLAATADASNVEENLENIEELEGAEKSQKPPIPHQLKLSSRQKNPLAMIPSLKFREKISPPL